MKQEIKLCEVCWQHPDCSDCLPRTRNRNPLRSRTYPGGGSSIGPIAEIKAQLSQQWPISYNSGENNAYLSILNIITSCKLFCSGVPVIKSRFFDFSSRTASDNWNIFVRLEVKIKVQTLLFSFLMRCASSMTIYFHTNFFKRVRH